MKDHLLIILLCICIIFLPAMSLGAEPGAKKVEKEIAIRFYGLIEDKTVSQLLNFMDSKRKEGTTDFIILISSPGGNVNAGLTAYNYLKGMPPNIKVTTHNFGSVDSIGVIMYCGGSKRLSVPEARFLFHPITLQVSGPHSFDEKLLEEYLKSLRVDTENIAKIIVANANRSLNDVYKAMFERTVLGPSEAKTWGLVHEINPRLYDSETPTYYIDAISKK